MKLIFGPFYDRGAYLSRECIMGEKTVGPMGLLEELELRTGTVGMSDSESVRTAHYLKAITKSQDGTERFYAESFNVDRLGVAAELLSWRDALVLAGWNSGIKGISPKLDDLAEIEKNFHSRGIADRWREILSVLSKKENRLPDDLEIEVRMPESLLLPYLKDVLKAVSEKGNTVSYDNEDTSEHLEELINKNKLRIIPFLDIYQATEWASWHLKDFNAVISNNNLLLNDYLCSEGKPELRSEARACNAEILQLFKLTYNCLREPKDIRDIIAFLSFRKNPVDRRLSSKLISHLTRDEGFSEKWQKTLKDFESNNNIDKKTKERSLFFIKLIDENKGTEGISKTTLDECNKYFSSWVDGQINALEADPKEKKDTERREFHALGEFLKAMQILIDGAESTISYAELENWVKFIYKPQNILFCQAEKGSVDSICDIRCIAEPVEKVLWTNCTGTDESLYAYSFLSMTEIRKLSEAPIHIPSKDLCAQAYNYALQAGLNRIQELTLTVPEFGNREKLVEHPLITEIQKRKGKKDKPQTLPATEAEAFTEEGSHVEKALKKDYYQLNEIDTKSIKREYESYSSLESLIQFPFEYMLKYFAGIEENDKLSDLNRTKGNVAHKYIELLFNKAKSDSAKPKDINAEDKQASSHPMAEQAIHEAGLILEVEENHISKTSFLEQLYKSVDALIEILEQNHLQFIDSEMGKRTIPLSEIENIQDGENLMKAMDSRIDFVCKDAKDNIYIIDLKWSKEKRYTEILQNSQDLQLAYYKKTLELKGNGLTGTVAAYGYFLLTCGTLLIPKEYTGLLSGEHIKAIERKDESVTASKIIDQAFLAYKFRMDQFQKGIVEEAEGMELEKLNYPEDCYPLKTEGQNKGYAYGKPNKTIKGDLK